MADRYLKARIQCSSTGLPGRHILNAGRNHLIFDDVVPHGGPGEAINAMELFMGGIAACATLMMERIARAEALKLDRVEVTMDGAIDTQARHEGPAVLSSAHLIFTMAGIDQAKAREMVETYKHT